MSHGAEKYEELRYMATAARKLGGTQVRPKVVQSLCHLGRSKCTNLKWLLEVRVHTLIPRVTT